MAIQLTFSEMMAQFLDKLTTELRDFVPKKRIVEMETKVATLVDQFSETVKEKMTEKIEEEMQAMKATLKPTKVKKEKVEKPVKEKKEKKVAKKAEGPKKPLTSYFLFVKEKTASVKETHPDMASKDVAKTLGGMWKSLSDAEKLPYTEKAAADRARYQAEKEANPVSDESASESENESGDEDNKGKKAKKEKKEKKDPNAPKRPLSSYILFCNDTRGKIRAEHPDMGATDVTRQLGKMWRELSEAVQGQWKNRQ